MTKLEALRAMKEAVEAGEWLVGAAANVPELHTDLTWKAFNGSLDAARALHEAVLPGWDWIIGRTNDGLTIHANVGGEAEAFADCPARAWLIAILAALIAQEEGQ